MKEIMWESVLPRKPQHQGPVVQSTDRASIPGGWLVRESTLILNTLPQSGAAALYVPAVAITFVPDPDHKWGME